MSEPPVDDLLAAIAADSFLADLGLGGIGASHRTSEALERLIDATAIVAGSNSELYEMVADQLELDGLEGMRSKLGPAVLRDLADFNPDRETMAAKGRERLYWLAVALADRLTPEGHVDLQAVLQRAFETSQRSYELFYRRVIEIAGREPIGGNDDQAFSRLQLLINVFLEGVTAAQRSGRQPSDDDVVTAVLALFHAFTKRPGQPAFDPEAALISEGKTAPSAQSIRADGEDASYALVVHALRSLPIANPSLIQHASLHGLSGANRPRTQEPKAVVQLRQTMLERVQAGWKLHRLVTVHSEDDLDREIEVAKELREHGKIRVHATVGGVGGHIAAIVVKERFVALGLDDPDTSYVGQAVLTEEATAIAFWAEHFAQLFGDRRNTFVIASPAGLDSVGIAELRRRVRGLTRLIGDAPDVIELTAQQRNIIERLGRTPRPQLQEIADELFIQRDTVKKHCEKLCDQFGIPKGRDRLGPLVAELQRRGLV